MKRQGPRVDPNKFTNFIYKFILLPARGPLGRVTKLMKRMSYAGLALLVPTSLASLRSEQSERREKREVAQDGEFLIHCPAPVCSALCRSLTSFTPHSVASPERSVGRAERVECTTQSGAVVTHLTVVQLMAVNSPSPFPPLQAHSVHLHHWTNRR